MYTFGGPNATRPVVIFNDVLAGSERPWDNAGPASQIGFAWEGRWDAPNGTVAAGVGGSWPRMPARPGFSIPLNVSFAVPDPGSAAPPAGRHLYLVMQVTRPLSVQPNLAFYTEDRVFVRVQRA